MSDKNFDKVEKLEAWAGERGHTILEAGLRLAAGPRGGVLGDRRRDDARAGEDQRRHGRLALTPDEVDEVGKLIG